MIVTAQEMRIDTRFLYKSDESDPVPSDQAGSAAAVSRTFASPLQHNQQVRPAEWRSGSLVGSAT